MVDRKGAILLDPSLDVDNVEGDLWIATVGIGHVFGLAGRQARVLAVLPIAWGTVAGDVHGQAEQEDLAGPVDPRIKLSIGLRGATALTPARLCRRSAPRRRRCQSHCSVEAIASHAPSHATTIRRR